ncbi:hypothetical protein U3516DRAFT_747575 [Neocallimastix sp. 'constans']
MVSKNNESSNSSDNITSTSNNSREKETLDNSVLANKGFQKLLEAINNNHGNLEQIPKAISGYTKGDEGTNNVPFHIKNFHLTSINFQQWYIPLVHHLISTDLINFIEIQKETKSMNQLEIKNDNKTQSIIESSLDEEGNDILKGCKTAFEIMSRLKEIYYQTECDKLNKESLYDNNKITHIFKELINTRIHPIELDHIDVVSRFKISNRGFKFYVNFLDDYSRKC